MKVMKVYPRFICTEIVEFSNDLRKEIKNLIFSQKYFLSLFGPISESRGEKIIKISYMRKNTFLFFESRSLVIKFVSIEPY